LIANAMSAMLRRGFSSDDSQAATLNLTFIIDFRLHGFVGGEGGQRRGGAGAEPGRSQGGARAAAAAVHARRVTGG
jgi:hypothetical protein